MSHKPVWHLANLPTEVCDKAFEELMAIPAKDATMGEGGQYVNKQHRNTTIRFAPESYWLNKIMRDFAEHANKECDWGYDVNRNESLQFAEYKTDQHYDWHVDIFPLGEQPYDRKITVVILLNDPSEFEGGQLKIKLYQEYDAPLVRGSIIAFPSMLEHAVTPVLNGVRYSATMWVSGPRFR